MSRKYTSNNMKQFAEQCHTFKWSLECFCKIRKKKCKKKNIYIFKYMIYDDYQKFSLAKKLRGNDCIKVDVLT